MSLDVRGITNALVSHAMASGLFEVVNGHEPKSAPGNGLTAAVWVQDIGPQEGGSGLQSTTGRLAFTVRIYNGMLSEPRDDIDPNVLSAVDTLIAAYSGDFELGGLVRNVDLLGMSGTPLSARAGYLNQNNTLYRVMDINVPVIINDLWSQSG
jgi:hypothetical protein